MYCLSVIALGDAGQTITEDLEKMSETRLSNFLRRDSIMQKKSQNVFFFLIRGKFYVAGKFSRNGLKLCIDLVFAFSTSVISEIWQKITKFPIPQPDDFDGAT